MTFRRRLDPVARVALSVAAIATGVAIALAAADHGAAALAAATIAAAAALSVLRHLLNKEALR